MNRIEEIFGSLVFNDKVMRERLAPSVYEDLMLTINEGKTLTRETANEIALAMKDWAVENGATHYTHWFQPMTGITAEKHDSFIEPDNKGGVILKFSGKALIKGESDASSFPSGGLRATFEARGYTAWDPTSYAFIKDGTLCIPTAFCSYDGSALDKKTPLLRSNEALNTAALRILKLFGKTDVKKIIVQVGAEQEYFLIDKKVADERLDITLCGRTLFGANPTKGQEMDDHYYGSIKHRVSKYMKDLDNELWKHGVYSKTKHNEVAPAQHELAPIFCDDNTATDQNQLTMDLMKSVARKHDMLCLLHEKPFKSVNGSGKHNNWSISTDTGINLLEPGSTPHENAQFLLFLTATIVAVDEYQDVLRASVATASNDHRLGANEAPPSIVSIFLGDDLTELLNSIENHTDYECEARKELEIGVHTVPKFKKDTTDRNRTSPFAFTGNKFEFRMVGSSLSISEPNIVLNTAIAEILSRFADELEKAEDFKTALNELIIRNIKEHKRIIFNGNNYSEDWAKEAKKRKLCNLPTTVDAVPSYITKKNIELFTKHGVFSTMELFSRCDIFLENYYKTINIEALTMINMAKRAIIPSCYKFEKTLADLVIAKKGAGVSTKMEDHLLSFVCDNTDKLIKTLKNLETALSATHPAGVYEIAKYYRDKILPIMEEVRKFADSLEQVIPKDIWPIPTYNDLLYSIR